jgi:hypothetical protein
MTKELIEVPIGAGKTAKVSATRHEGKKFNGVETKVQAEGEKAYWERVGKAAEAFNAFHKAYGTDFNLEPEEIVSAMYLEILNWKEFYPENLGGPKHFDEICKEVWAWFEDNKNKS